MWKDAYKIGVQQIDQQHKQLVETLARLLAALKAEEPARTAACKSAMDFIKNYSVVHFGTEEMYQSEIGFPEKDAHKKLHDGFVESMREYEFELMRSGYAHAVMQRFADELVRWWIYHITREDKKMAAFGGETGG